MINLWQTMDFILDGTSSNESGNARKMGGDSGK